MLKKLLKRLLFGHTADSDMFIRHLRRKGMRIGAGTCFFDPRRSFVDETRPWMVQIGKNVQITRGVTILTHGYDWSVLKGKYGCVLGSCGKVTIGDNVFIGAGAMIIGNVHVGNNARIGANAIVTSDVPENTVVVASGIRMVQKDYPLNNKFLTAAAYKKLMQEQKMQKSEEKG